MAIQRLIAAAIIGVGVGFISYKLLRVNNILPRKQIKCKHIQNIEGTSVGESGVCRFCLAHFDGKISKCGYVLHESCRIALAGYKEEDFLKILGPNCFDYIS